VAGSWAPTATLKGWTAASGDFETWNHLTVSGQTYTASDGVQSIELDSGMGLDRFYQDVQTASGAQYTLSFDAAMRAGTPSSTGTIQVFWNGNLIDSFDPTSTSWATHSYTVTGDGGSDRLTFGEDAADNDSLGGLIDNVGLVGNDILDGGAGNDTLIGDAGNDTLIGGQRNRYRRLFDCDGRCHGQPEHDGRAEHRRRYRYALRDREPYRVGLQRYPHRRRQRQCHLGRGRQRHDCWRRRSRHSRRRDRHRHR